MEYYKNIEDMLTHQFENDGEKDDNGEKIKATGSPISEKEWKDLKTNQLTKKIEVLIPQQSPERNINYEELKRSIIENNWFFGERKFAAQLLWALRKKDLKTIDDFLAFGNDPHHAISNVHRYEALKTYGFLKIQFNEHGWINNPDWLNIETIKLDEDNTITVGMGLNEKWAYGFECQNTTSGHFEGVNEWREPFTSKDAAIKEGMEKIKQFHIKALNDQSKPQKCRTIANKVLQKIKEYNNPIQGSIFDDVTKSSNTKNSTKNKEMGQEATKDKNLTKKDKDYIPEIDVYDINKVKATKEALTNDEILKLHAEHIITDTEKEDWLNENSRLQAKTLDIHTGDINDGLIIKKQDFEKMLDYFIKKRYEGEDFIAFNSDSFPVERNELFTFSTQEEAAQFCRDNVLDMDSYNYLATRSIYRSLAEAKLNDTLMIENGSGAIDISRMVAARYQRLETRQRSGVNMLESQQKKTATGEHSVNESTNKFNNSQKTNTMEQENLNQPTKELEQLGLGEEHQGNAKKLLRNLHFLENQIKYLGFGDKQKQNLRELWAESLKNREPMFNLTIKQQYDGYPIDYTLHFDKSKESDMYFLNSYDAAMANGRHQTIYLDDKGKGFTAKETFNLMQDRAVFKELRKKDNSSSFNAWITLSEPDKGKNVNDSRKIHLFNENYGYNLEQTLANYPIKELKDEGDKKKLLASLQKGNRQAVYFLMPNGSEERKFIEARPKGRGLNIFNKNGKPMEREHTANKENKKPIQKVTPDDKRSAGVRR